MFVILYLGSDCLCEKSTKKEIDNHKESFDRNTASKIYCEFNLLLYDTFYIRKSKYHLRTEATLRSLNVIQMEICCFTYLEQNHLSRNLKEYIQSQ